MKYFSLKELTYSNKALASGIDNTPTKQQEYNLIKLVDAILDPLREKYGKPITVSSGFRNNKVNSLVGGSKSSQHLEGKAADLQVIINKKIDCVENRKLYDILVNNKFPFDQLIIEKGTKDKPMWIHVSYDETRNRREKLYTHDGKTYVKL